MDRWGLVTWFGFLMLMFIIVVYWQGFTKSTGAAAGAIGTTVAALTGTRSYTSGAQVGYPAPVKGA